MRFNLPKLPYKDFQLEPILSKETLTFHYSQHHKGYIDKVNAMIAGTKFKNLNLEDIVKKSEGALYNNASQAWNHTFYWNCMQSSDLNKSKDFPKILKQEMEKSFGSLEEFKKIFIERALQLFGSGWVWLVADKNQQLHAFALPNAESPLCQGLIPLLVCDLWEHAYYIDYRNNRKQYVENFLEIVDWKFVDANLMLGEAPNMTRLMISEQVKPIAVKTDSLGAL